MTISDLIPQAALMRLRAASRKLWVRVVGMGLLALLSLALTDLGSRVLPQEWEGYLSGAAADRLLQIIANAMLAVTTFSLTVMVTVYRSTSTQWTPRLHRLIVQDRTTQNTLAVFIGAYVYALIAIILREFKVFTDDRALVLFVTTVLVLVIIVTYLIRWVLHLQTFGSLIDSTRQIETVTKSEFVQRLKTPCLGARPLINPVPEGAEVIVAPESGYIQHIYVQRLQDIARKSDITLYLTRNVGSFVFINQPMAFLVRTGGNLGADARDALHKAICCEIVLGDVRTYEQDPRFGLIVMAEVGSRALSPGVNDPGTAIDVITRIGRILSNYTDERLSQPLYDRLYVEPLDPVDLITDGFGAIARDGADTLEVQLRLQATLQALSYHPDAGLADAARSASHNYLHRALEAMRFEGDRAELTQAVQGR